MKIYKFLLPASLKKPLCVGDGRDTRQPQNNGAMAVIGVAGKDIQDQREPRRIRCLTLQEK